MDEMAVPTGGGAGLQLKASADWRTQPAASKGGLKAHLLHQQPPEGLHQGFLGGQVQDTGGRFVDFFCADVWFILRQLL